MEDLASSIMSLPHRRHSAPLYLFLDIRAFPKHHGEQLLYDMDDGGFEFAAAATAKNVDDDDSSAVPRACASDVSAFADELFRGGALLPLKLPPRLQWPASWSTASSATTSPTERLGKTRSWSSFASRRRQRGFDPFAAALLKVRWDCAAPAPRRARSLPRLRGAAAAAGLNSSHSAGTEATAQNASTRTVRESSAAAPRALRPRRRGDSGAPWRSGLLVCFGF